MIVYKLTDGFAHDLRFEEEDYKLEPDERKYAEGFGALPSLSELHEPAAAQAKEIAEAAARLRLSGLRADALTMDLLERLRSASSSQLSAYVDGSVTDLPGARALLKRMLLVLALLAGGN